VSQLPDLFLFSFIFDGWMGKREGRRSASKQMKINNNANPKQFKIK
jgi:hypothetical protein